MTKKILSFISLVFLFVLCFIYKEECVAGVVYRMRLSFTSVIPALFPFIFLSNLTILTAPQKSADFFAVLFGLFCGYPVGAKSVAELYTEKRISKSYAEKLVICSNNAGPVMAVMLCGKNVYQSEKTGWLFFIIQALFSVFMFFLIRKGEKPKTDLIKSDFSVTDGVIHSAKLAAFSSINISSFIIIFSFIEKVIFAFLKIKSKFYAFFLSILFEVTGGFSLASELEYSVTLPLSFFAMAFGGFSVILQSIGILKEAGLGISKYILGKVAFALFMFIIGLFLTKLL